MASTLSKPLTNEQKEAWATVSIESHAHPWNILTHQCSRCKSQHVERVDNDFEYGWRCLNCGHNTLRRRGQVSYERMQTTSAVNVDEF